MPMIKEKIFLLQKVFPRMLPEGKSAPPELLSNATLEHPWLRLTDYAGFTLFQG